MTRRWKCDWRRGIINDPCLESIIRGDQYSTNHKYVEKMVMCAFLSRFRMLSSCLFCPLSSHYLSLDTWLVFKSHTRAPLAILMTIHAVCISRWDHEPKKVKRDSPRLAQSLASDRLYRGLSISVSSYPAYSPPVGKFQWEECSEKVKKYLREIFEYENERMFTDFISQIAYNTENARERERRAENTRANKICIPPSLPSFPPLCHLPLYHVASPCPFWGEREVEVRDSSLSTSPCLSLPLPLPKLFPSSASPLHKPFFLC